MKALLIIAVIGLVCGTLEAAKCIGKDPCKACRTCKDCVHCSIPDQKCGVCSKSKEAAKKKEAEKAKAAKVKP